MPKILKLRRGNADATSTFVGSSGEVTINTTSNVLVVHDGITPGGHPQNIAAVTATISPEPPLNPVRDMWTCNPQVLVPQDIIL